MSVSKATTTVKKAVAKKTTAKKAVSKENALVAHWKVVAEAKKGTNYNLELKKSDLQSRADLIQADTDLIEAETKASHEQEAYDNALGQIGSDWSPAKIVNAKNRLQDAQEDVRYIKLQIVNMKKLISDYIG